MFKAELIISAFLSQEFLIYLKEYAPEQYYTQIPSAYGLGTHGGRFGDVVWPETNTIFCLICSSEEELGKVEKAYKALQRAHSKDGMKMYVYSNIRLVP